MLTLKFRDCQENYLPVGILYHFYNRESIGQKQGDPLWSPAEVGSRLRRGFAAPGGGRPYPGINRGLQLPVSGLAGLGGFVATLENDGPHHDNRKQTRKGHQAPANSSFINFDGIILQIGR